MTLLVTSVGNLQTARALALDDNFAVKRAQLDLPNVTVSDVGLLGDQRRSLEAATRFALRNVLTTVDANFCRPWVENRAAT
jgi:hypothetical protein